METDTSWILQDTPGPKWECHDSGWGGDGKDWECRDYGGQQELLTWGGDGKDYRASLPQDRTIYYCWPNILLTRLLYPCSLHNRSGHSTTTNGCGITWWCALTERTMGMAFGAMLWHTPRIQITQHWQWVWPLRWSPGIAQENNNTFWPSAANMNLTKHIPN